MLKASKENERTMIRKDGGNTMNINKLREILVWLFTPVTDESAFRMHTGFELLY